MENASAIGAPTIKIMPIGDSITQGITSGVPDEAFQVSYRKALYDKLKTAGYVVNFVGTLISGESVADFDPDHEGHPGWRADKIVAGRTGSGEGKLSDWLLAEDPDIILLHIGTNDIFRANEDWNEVEDILEVVDDYEFVSGKAVWVVLSLIIDRGCDPYIPPCTKSLETTNFNEDVRDFVFFPREAGGDKIVLLDMQNDAGINYDRWNLGGDMWDDVHPFETGYDKMASLWFSALIEILPQVAPEVGPGEEIPTLGVTVTDEDGLESVDTVSVDLRFSDNCPNDPSKVEPGICGCRVADVDADGDGTIDCAESNADYDGVPDIEEQGPDGSVLLGSDDGTFQNAVNYSAGNRPDSVAIGDLNGDSDSDLAVANKDSDNVSIFINTGGREIEHLCNGKRPTILGTEGHDVINGTEGPDVIHGIGGIDIIRGLGGDDVICGGDGSDVIGSGSGNDIVLGENGHDAIWGGPGDDILRGGDGNDTISGGSSGNDSLHGNYGNDSLYGKSRVDRLYGGAGPDNNDTCYDTAGTFNLECEVFYEE
jgi:lysophospholipase L1-like esterase